MESAAVPASAVREQLARVLESTAFRTAGRSSRLLRFVVEETLAGRADRLKDYTLGAEALGRGDDFDPRTDPIARVEASRLRSRLELYYATEGTADPLVILLPKGGYVPRFETRSAAPAADPRRLLDRRQVVRALPASVLGVAAAALAWRWWPDAPAPLVRSLSMPTPRTLDAASLAIAPDDRHVVFVASTGGVARLWLCPLSSWRSASPLNGTDHASLPFWSPDSRSIGFFADGRVKRIDIESLLVKEIAVAAVPAGGAWNADGAILYPLVPDGPLVRASADGSSLSPVRETALGPGHTGHRGPHFLPDGRHFVFHVMGPSDVKGIHVARLGAAGARRLTDADTPAVFAAPDLLLYVLRGILFAHRFDLGRMQVIGEPVPVPDAEGLATGSGAAIAALSASASGTIVYRTGPAGGKRQFVRVDRQGRELARLGTPENFGTAAYASLSPDGRRLAVQRMIRGNADIYMVDLERNIAEPLTTGPLPDIAPLWSPAANRIVYSARHDGSPFALYQRTIGNPSSEPEFVMMLPGRSLQATDWSRDGTLLVRAASRDLLDWDIWAVPPDGDPFEVLGTEADERNAELSPDGRWMAYQTNRTGRFEIWVDPFRREGERRRVSVHGGVHARWNPNGRELFFLGLDGRLTVVPVRSGPGDQAFEWGPEEPLFHARVGALQDLNVHPYIVLDRGREFLLDAVVEEDVDPITVLLGWRPGLT